MNSTDIHPFFIEYLRLKRIRSKFFEANYPSPFIILCILEINGQDCSAMLRFEYAPYRQDVDRLIDHLAVKNGTSLVLRAIPIALIASYRNGQNNVIGIVFVAVTARGSYRKELLTSHLTIEYHWDIDSASLLPLIWEAIANEAFSSELAFLNNGLYRLMQRVHWEVLEKSIFAPATQKIHARIFDVLHEGLYRTVIDVSCGNSNLVFELAPYVQLCVGNDREWDRTRLNRTKNRPPNLFLTGFDVLKLPIAKKFDLCICKNTLHHMRDEASVVQLLRMLKQTGRDVILIDPQPPWEGSIMARLYHEYHRNLMGDKANRFLSESSLKMLVDRVFSEAHVRYETVRIWKGNYHFLFISQG